MALLAQANGMGCRVSYLEKNIQSIKHFEKQRNFELGENVSMQVMQSER
jgi:hypothetical protein